ncbi:hypothetical protein BPAE_0258g00080 [Botrytis paeoniae]|uniref:Uncharacterized protein n=1 Tax=Botrytis paeoniae TaxID=278948 RepID=A0A4Z1FGY3_9HELO|nr:hypothetical protein BPAE_0258g00080 [Botrytis paeoniae]
MKLHSTYSGKISDQVFASFDEMVQLLHIMDKSMQAQKAAREAHAALRGPASNNNTGSADTVTNSDKNAKKASLHTEEQKQISRDNDICIKCFALKAVKDAAAAPVTKATIADVEVDFDDAS